MTRRTYLVVIDDSLGLTNLDAFAELIDVLCKHLPYPEIYTPEVEATRLILEKMPNVQDSVTAALLLLKDQLSTWRRSR